ncbi:MAG: universal stress protein [Pseudomonadota bacterium]
MFQTIVVAIDGSEPARRALDTACQLAKTLGGEIHLVHALENTASDADKPGTSAVMTAAVHQAEVLGISPASTTVGEGDPFEEIMTIADLYSADLVVAGRRGMSGLGGLLAGSTSQQLAKGGDFAFLSVK